MRGSGTAGALDAIHDQEESRAFSDRFPVLDAGRRDEKGAGERPPILKPRRIAEVFGMSFDAVPTDYQAVLRRVFSYALEAHRPAALRGGKHRRSGRDRRQPRSA